MLLREYHLQESAAEILRSPSISRVRLKLGYAVKVAALCQSSIDAFGMSSPKKFWGLNTHGSLSFNRNQLSNLLFMRYLPCSIGVSDLAWE